MGVAVGADVLLGAGVLLGGVVVLGGAAGMLDGDVEVPTAVRVGAGAAWAKPGMEHPVRAPNATVAAMARGAMVARRMAPPWTRCACP